MGLSGEKMFKKLKLNKINPSGIFFKITLGNIIIISMTVFLFLVLSIVFALFMVKVSSDTMKDNNIKNYIDSLVKDNYENIDISVISKYDGWLEVLKDNKIVYIKGNKLDKVTEYSTGELVDILQETYNSPSVNTNLKEYVFGKSFKDKTGHELILLVKFPTDGNKDTKLKLMMSTTPSGFYYDEKNLDEKVKKIMFLIYGGFFITSLIFLLLVSKLISKNIANPIKHIIKGIEEISGGNYSYRINCKADSELATIRDALNSMSEKIQNTEEEKYKIEENKKIMIADISHDLKTPITSIEGYAIALRDDMVSDPIKRKKYLEYILKKSERMNYLIDELFSFSKMDASTFKLNLEKTDICEFYRRTIIEHLPELEKNKFSYEINICDESIFVSIDKQEMYRAISNLISNSLKYNPEGTKIIFNLRKVQEDVFIEVIDNGIGMDKELQEVVFNEFTRGDKTRVSSGGAGLGLAISKKIVELHGGKIELYSALDVGTSFKISLMINNNL